MRWQAVKETLFCQDDGRARVLEDEGNALGGVFGIEWNVCTARFHDGDKRKDKGWRTVHEDGNSQWGGVVRGSRWKKPQDVQCELIGTLVEFAIGYLRRAEKKGGRIGGALRLRGNQGVDGVTVGIRQLGAVPFNEDLVRFVCSEKGQGIDAGFRVGDDGLEQSLETGKHARDGRVVKKVGVVFKDHAMNVTDVGDSAGEVKLGSGAIQVEYAFGQIGHVEIRHRDIDDVEHGLDKGCVAGVALGIQFCDELGEGHVLMRECCHRNGAHAL